MVQMGVTISTPVTKITADGSVEYGAEQCDKFFEDSFYQRPDCEYRLEIDDEPIPAVDHERLRECFGSIIVFLIEKLSKARASRTQWIDPGIKERRSIIDEQHLKT